VDSPRDRLELEVSRAFVSLLGVEMAGPADDFFALGGPSLLAVRLLARLREATGITLPLASLFRHATVSGLAGALRAGGGRAPASSLVTLRAGGPLPPLVLVHPVGGGVLCYAPLVRRLRPVRPVLALQSPGLDDDRPPASSLAGMARDYLDELAAQGLAMPVHLAGWSLGGVVAQEMARQLECSGAPPASLVLLDAWAPSGGGEMPSELELVRRFARDLGAGTDLLAADHSEAAREADDGAAMERLLGRARREGLLPTGYGEASLRRAFAIFKNNFACAMNHVPAPSHRPIDLLRAAEPALPADRGWSRCAGGGLRIHELPGDHYSLLREPRVEALAVALDALLAPASDVLAAPPTDT